MISTTQDEYHSKVSSTVDFLFSGCLIVLGILGVTSNSLILVVFCRMRHLVKPVEWLVVFLAGIDCVLIIFTFPMPIASGMRHEWSFRDEGCQAYAFFAFLVGFNQITAITLMSVVRYLKVCVPSAGKYLTGRNIVISMACGSLYCLLWASAPYFDFGEYGIEMSGLTCSVNWRSHSKNTRSYIISIMLFAFVIPVGITTCSYIGIIRYIRSKKRIHFHSVAPKMQISTKMMVCMSMTFFVTWLPYAIASLWVVLMDNQKPARYVKILLLVPCIVAKTSAIVNPFIYFVVFKKYRGRIYTLFGTHTGNIVQPETIPIDSPNNANPTCGQSTLPSLPSAHTSADIGPQLPTSVCNCSVDVAVRIYPVT